jgi:D-lactate dehydrogenase (cytochrome)
MILIRPDVEADLAEAKRFTGRLTERALAMEGTCTGEHGVGLGKIDWLRKEHGDGVDLMAAIKRTLDPENLLNPGKVVPVED